LLRGGSTDEQLGAAVGAIWGAREDRYSQLRSVTAAAAEPAPGGASRRVEMHYIGG
jgi:cyclic pyranopterin phosphate synthase